MLLLRWGLTDQWAGHTTGILMNAASFGGMSLSMAQRTWVRTTTSFPVVFPTPL